MVHGPIGVALTVDLEEWFHGPRALGRDVPTEPEQVVEATLPILDLLRHHRSEGTFFIVGEVATRHPEVVEAIVRDGHELGCHGMTHRTLQSLGPEGLREELFTFRSVIGDITGLPAPVAFRAPAFSLDSSTSWAIPILADLGYRYDSSVVPMKTPFYGVPRGLRQPYWPKHDDVAIEGDQHELVEFPISVFRFGPVRFPCGGGVYFRALPLPIYSGLLRRSGAVAVFYIHPWETHGGTPSITGLPWWHDKLRHHGYDRALRRLDRLLGDQRFAWGSLTQVLERSPTLLRG